MRVSLGVGVWRIYFNRHQSAPLVWCVRPDGEHAEWELAVSDIMVTDGATCVTRYRPRDKPDDESGVPSAYLVVTGELILDCWRALVTGTRPAIE